MGKYLPKKTFEKLLSTYTGVEVENNWQALFTMIKLFSKFASEIAAALGFTYNIDEEKASMDYLQKIYSMIK